MIVGFTGTRHGMRNCQHQTFIDLMWRKLPTRFNHGACIGADEEAALSVSAMSHAPCEIHAYPGKSAMGEENEYRSQKALEVSTVVHPTKTHFARNRDIVSTSDVLVAAPWQQECQIPKTGGGGTMFTIQFAIKMGKPVHVIWPNGRVDDFNIPHSKTSERGVYPLRRND